MLIAECAALIHGIDEAPTHERTNRADTQISLLFTVIYFRIHVFIVDSEFKRLSVRMNMSSTKSTALKLSRIEEFVCSRSFGYEFPCMNDGPWTMRRRSYIEDLVRRRSRG